MDRATSTFELKYDQASFKYELFLLLCVNSKTGLQSCYYTFVCSIGDL